jgi:adenylate cyclase
MVGTHNLALLNFRPEYRADWMRRSHYHQIALAPLGADAIRELLEDLIGSDPSTRGLGNAIHERTRGNPFFAEEIVRALIETGQLEGSRGSYRMTSPIEQLAVPDSVQALLAARIDRLSERDKRVLQTAAVIGKQFRGPILEHVSELASSVVRESLASLRNAEFVYEEALYPVAEYAFKHPLTQEVALSSQLRERRRGVHAAVARAIEAVDAGKLDEQAALLAHHWKEAGEDEVAAGWYARAASWAMRSDAAQALRHWLRVKELTAPLTTDHALALAGLAHRELVNLAWRVGRPASESREIFIEGRRILEQSRDLRSLVLLYANYAITGGIHSRERVECYWHANRIAAEQGDLDLRLAAGSAMFPLAYAGLVREAIAQADATLALVRPGEKQGPALLHFDPCAWLFSARGWCRALLGDLAGAVADSDRGIELAVREGEDYDRLLAYTLRTDIERWRGDPASALDYGQRQYDLAMRTGGPASAAFASNALGEALIANGRAREALPLFEQACATSLELDAYWVPRGLATVLIECGETAPAVETVREHRNYALANGGGLNELLSQVEFAATLVKANGDAAEALAALARARELVEEIGARGIEPQVHEIAAALHARLGEEEARVHELTAALRAYEALGATGHVERVARMVSARA